MHDCLSQAIAKPNCYIQVMDAEGADLDFGAIYRYIYSKE